MSEEMKKGARLAYQGVKEKMDNIIAELKIKGLDEPKGFLVLQGFIEDRMREME